jgi:hypothetical protein
MFSWIYPTKSENLSPKKIIEIKNKELFLNNLGIEDNNKISIFSIIGTARTGKSTLLNCIGSYLLKKNVKIFNIDDTDEHCTIGIDMYYFKDNNIVLLDCQGLKLDDSSNDPKLLLIIYLISDCIIYNQRSMLNNDIFETLQPLATFINYIENITYKPKLIFRILDSELKFEPKKLLDKTLSPKKDQYQNTREAMINLFDSIELFITNSLDRSEKKLLEQHKFYDFLLAKENNFMSTIEKILTKKTNNKSLDIWYNSINTFITNINTNKKIDFNKLDIYQICVEKEILEFKLTIDTDNYKDFSCGILQSDYEKIVVPKIEYKDNILKLFHSKFNMASKKIYNLHFDEIKNKLENPISNITKSIEERTISHIENAIKTHFADEEYLYLLPHLDIYNDGEKKEKEEKINVFKKNEKPPAREDTDNSDEDTDDYEEKVVEEEEEPKPVVKSTKKNKVVVEKVFEDTDNSDEEKTCVSKKNIYVIKKNNKSITWKNMEQIEITNANFLKTISPYYKPIVLKYIEKYLTFINNIEKKIIAIKIKQKENYDFINKYFTEINNKCNDVYEIIKKSDFIKNCINPDFIKETNFMEFKKILKQSIISNLLVKTFKSLFVNTDILTIYDKPKIYTNSCYQKLIQHQFLFIDRINCSVGVITDNYTSDYSCSEIVQNSINTNSKMKKEEKEELINRIKAKNYIEESHDKMIKEYIDKQIRQIEKRINEDKQIEKIINTKIEQTKLYYFRNTYNKDELSKRFIALFGKIEFKDDKIEKKIIRKKLYLKEFKKYIEKKYKKKIIIDKVFINNLLLSDTKDDYVGYKLFKNFLMERQLLSSKINGIKIL